MNKTKKDRHSDSVRARMDAAFQSFLEEYEGTTHLDEMEKARLKWMFERGYTHASVHALQGQNLFLNAELTLRSAPRTADMTL